ncbi:MAG: Crp/Fnr family transcriptional regulator [Actinomycetota bacterium]|nr:Crp/Fnr family transcriptional regulator [Actinomycetota bacterium]
MKAEQAASMLARTALFSALQPEQLTQLAARTSERRYRKGQALFFLGDPGDALFVLVEGLVKVVVTSDDGEQMVLATLEPPSVFGELALLDGGPRSASVEALMPTTVLVLGREDLMGVIVATPAVAEAMLRSLGSLVRRMTEQAGDLVFLDLHGRVAKLLLGLAADRGGEPAGGVAMDLHLTQGDLAAMVGGSRQSINQILHQFERRGYLDIRGRSIVLKDVEALRRRAGLAS